MIMQVMLIILFFFFLNRDSNSRRVGLTVKTEGYTVATLVKYQDTSPYLKNWTISLLY